ncbi:hypothetical protein SERLA73DRAFT_184019 [Serpula lacrymans var. lacrymans S7.3]|uniref:Uncharacterized protein n=1 Tax=Serpula lacrymans var. lacrymans (strain S7.3) TaxID=936435 RepID=F8Q2D5_SERL3|nr:hypothetical protein SERLA73DRAFT_184019 [Serpula lacrymans var. lacrymans S7.3]
MCSAASLVEVRKRDCCDEPQANNIIEAVPGRSVCSPAGGFGGNTHASESKALASLHEMDHSQDLHEHQRRLHLRLRTVRLSKSREERHLCSQVCSERNARALTY